MKKIFWPVAIVVVIIFAVLLFKTPSKQNSSSSEGSFVDKIKNIGSDNKTSDVASDKIVLYFANEKTDPEFLDCSKLSPVKRDVETGLTGENKYRYVLTQLLFGPSVDEASAGYSSFINSGVGIQDLSFVNGDLNVDFSVGLGSGVAGSCTVTAIRAQITDTLKQFSEVKNVNISIGGKREDILQP